MHVMHEAEKILLDEAPVLPLFTYVNKGMLSKKVAGWYPNILDQHSLKYINVTR
jgi:oligopeptide transport system substrate-binding protein